MSELLCPECASDKILIQKAYTCMDCHTLFCYSCKEIFPSKLSPGEIKVCPTCGRKIKNSSGISKEPTPTEPSYIDNPARKVYNIDFDGTLTLDDKCYDNPKPNYPVIKKTNELYRQGHLIIIWTARWWDNANEVVAWLIKHKVHFHGILMGKGGTDHYVDDKVINVKDFIKNDTN